METRYICPACFLCKRALEVSVFDRKCEHAILHTYAKSCSQLCDNEAAPIKETICLKMEEEDGR
jgi:hypothetical protein